ncbi:hypothetical protein LO772_32270 [Yinghuangia sp. ASG 101]|uniref:hypothetical protein n=1 Tax=Yinghuangia sp. ASG 101 TaxID=2896848 RepID=UPI001E598313|nr:hypothetical protein [Yinghuangia sp. ASG 101]UGQ11417.1 hypothetical protein LO772_32270 [Yinghuangia sp. ASG 101]
MIGIGVVVLVAITALYAALPAHTRRRLLPRRFSRHRPRGFVWKAFNADGAVRALEESERTYTAALGSGSMPASTYREAMERLARLDERRPVRVPQARNVRRP